MTIAISLKVNDGLVLAADSASTLIGRQPDGSNTVINVFYNANKVFNLRKGLPVGAVTWGAGAIGLASTSTLVKDLRERLSGQDLAHREWHLDPESSTVLGAAERLRSFMYDELYLPAFESWEEKPVLGFIVAGYSAGAAMAEEYKVEMSDSGCAAPVQLRPTDNAGVTWNGEPEAITRLVMGFSPAIGHVLQVDLGVPQAQVAPAMEILRANLAAQLIEPAMPFQDAVDLAEFLVDLTIRFSRFTPGAGTVGGPVEIAGITKHEGFKWIKRKHYYTRDLNPEVADADS